MDLRKELDKIRKKISSGIILFTGAGFSKNAFDYSNNCLPLGSELADEIWNLVYPNESRDLSSLKDIYHLAKKREPKRLKTLIQNRLRINPRSLPDAYGNFVRFPWEKVYTLNIDNIWEAMDDRFNSKLKLNIISATTQKNAKRGWKRFLDIIHLNGRLDDLPDNVIFTDVDYGSALGRENSYYNEFASEFMRQMVVFIGSELEESLLWKYITQREERKRFYGEKEYRPESYYVSPKLSKGRQSVLEEYNITWLPMTATEFSEKILSPLSEEASSILQSRINFQQVDSEHLQIPIISEKVKEKKTGYSKSSIYMGHQPVWEDVIRENLIKRELEIECYDYLNNYFENPALFWNEMPVIVIHGTAGDGKTAAMMNLLFKYSNSGHTVGWITSDDYIPSHALKKYLRNSPAIDILAIDDAEIYGVEIFDIIKDMYYQKLIKVAIVILRSGKWLSIESEAKNKDLEIHSFFTKKLNIREIKDLLYLLSEASMLGKLKQLTPEERVYMFQSKTAGDSQLIASLIEATSGQKFDEKIADEYSALDNIQKVIYALLSIPTHLRLGLTDIEISVCLGLHGNDLLNAINNLERARLIVKRRNGYQLRHRIIGLKVFEELISLGVVMEYFYNLAFGTAMLRQNNGHDQKKLRLIRKFCINHTTVLEYLASNYYKAKEFYEKLESVLKDDYQYWLQRGSFELEKDALDIAESCLINSLDLNYKDDIVHIQYAVLKMKRANSAQQEDNARKLFDEAKATLTTMISKRGYKDPYPYHILAHQGKIWLMRSFVKEIEKEALKSEFKYILDSGVKRHPLDEQLKQLQIEFYKIYFETV